MIDLYPSARMAFCYSCWINDEIEGLQELIPKSLNESCYLTSAILDDSSVHGFGSPELRLATKPFYLEKLEDSRNDDDSDYNLRGLYDLQSQGIIKKFGDLRVWLYKEDMPLDDVERLCNFVEEQRIELSRIAISSYKKKGCTTTKLRLEFPDFISDIDEKSLFLRLQFIKMLELTIADTPGEVTFENFIDYARCYQVSFPELNERINQI